MTDAELYTLIQSDAEAKQKAGIGDDSGCAERCSVIAPKIRKPVEAAALRKLLMKRGRWSELRRIANNIESTDPPFSQAMSLVDTIQAGVPVDLSDADLIAGGLVLVEHNLLSAEDLAAISTLANTPQVISTDQVSAAMAPHRGGT
jgi:hypothetical protein